MCYTCVVWHEGCLRDNTSTTFRASWRCVALLQYRAWVDRGGVSHRTLYPHARSLRSVEENIQSHRYLAPYDEDALVHFLLQLSNLRQPVRMPEIE